MILEECVRSLIHVLYIHTRRTYSSVQLKHFTLDTIQWPGIESIEETHMYQMLVSYLAGVKVVSTTCNI